MMFGCASLILETLGQSDALGAPAGSLRNSDRSAELTEMLKQYVDKRLIMRFFDIVYVSIEVVTDLVGC